MGSILELILREENWFKHVLFIQVYPTSTTLACNIDSTIENCAQSFLRAEGLIVLVFLFPQ